MHHLLEIWFGWVLNGGYLGIIALMAMESSIFPVPSEIVIPPAAFLAAQGNLTFERALNADAARAVDRAMPDDARTQHGGDTLDGLYSRLLRFSRSSIAFEHRAILP